MMELKVSEWKEFRLNKLFSIRRGDRIVKNEDYFDEPVDDTYVYPVVTASATNNGIDGLYNQSNCEGHCIVSCGEANGMFTTWQAKPFWGMDTIRIYQPIGFTMTEQLGLFFATLLSHNMYRFSYGRKAKPDNMYSLFLRLPVQHNAAGQPVIDPSRKYSDDGYVPDWDFMEQYIKSLNTQPLVTKRDGTSISALEVDRWKEFQVGRLFEVQLSKGDIKPDDVYDGEIPLVSSGESNNGVVAYLSKQGDGKAVIFNGGQLTIDMFCHAFYQPDDFFAVSHGRVNILSPLFDMHVGVGLFIATILNSDKYKYSYGRALYSNVADKMVIRLPVQHDVTGQPLIDPRRKYSDDGYIPDWAFMEQYIESLPGSDLLK